MGFKEGFVVCFTSTFPFAGGGARGSCSLTKPMSVVNRSSVHFGSVPAASYPTRAGLNGIAEPADDSVERCSSGSELLAITLEQHATFGA